MIPNFSVEVAIIIERRILFHDFNKMMKIMTLPLDCERAFKQLFIKLDDFDSVNAGKSSQLGKHGFGSLDDFN